MMNNLISKHLNSNLLNIPIEQVNTICAFTGHPISEGVRLKYLIKKTFTDQELIRYSSDYASVDIALMMEPTIQIYHTCPITNMKISQGVEYSKFVAQRGDIYKGISIKSNEYISVEAAEKYGYSGHVKKFRNSLRNYSFYATKKELKLLKRDEILDILLHIPETPFQIGITFSHKKHIAYRCIVNFDFDQFIITTDKGNVNFNKLIAADIVLIMQRWYKILPGEETSKLQPTYFTKKEISGEVIPKFSKVQKYGLKQYFQEDQFLNKYRKTLLFELLIYIINKN